MSKIVHLRNIKRALELKPTTETANCAFVVSGRVDNFRTYKSFNFIDLIDGSSNEHLQVIVKKDVLKKPDLGSYLTCVGNIKRSPGSQQAIEFKVDRVEFLGPCDPLKYPLARTNKVNIQDAWFRQHLHLRPRSSSFASLLRIRSELELSLHMILKQMDFFKVHTPVLTANDSEANSDLFMVLRSKPPSGFIADDDDDDDDESNDDLASGTEDERKLIGRGLATSQTRLLKESYFQGMDVFMQTSAQLHLECLAASLSRVYCLAPAFRAETASSQRHLCEFTMLEAEESNLTRLEPLMDRVESVIKFSAHFLGEVSEFKSDFSSLLDKYSNHNVYEKLTQRPYIRMTYDEAVRILQKKQSSTTPQCDYGCDINRWHERQLLDHCDQVPIFITNYPKSLKPFYMKLSDSDGQPDKVLNFDLIAPFGGEICGGSLREDNLEQLRANLNLSSHEDEAEGDRRNTTDDHDEKQQRPWQAANDKNQRAAFRWYLELREFGSFPHGGFGVGFERLIQSLLGIKNIKDTLAFPRWPGNCPM